MDNIRLNRMEFYGYHGVLPEENKLGQRFKVDVELFLDLRSAGVADDLTLTVNYAEVYKLCQEIVEKQQYKLVEAVAEKIAQEALERFTLLEEIVVRVIKPDPPIPGHYRSVEVEIRRGRWHG